MSEATLFLARLSALAEEIAATAQARDRDREYAHAFIERLRALGFWRLSVPKAYGGLGFDEQVLIQAVAIVAKADGSLGQIPQNHFNTVDRINLAGTSAQRDHFLSKVAAGQFFGNAAAEPGERYPGQATTALRRDGDGWRLNGRKVYATGALLADQLSVQCLDEQGRGCSALLERGAPGVQIIDDWDGLGQRTTASGSARFVDVAISALGVIAHPRDPQVAYRISSLSQLLHAAIDVGIAEGALQRAVELAQQVHGGRGSGAKAFVDDVLGVAQLGEQVLQVSTGRRLTESAARQLAAADADTPLQTVIASFHEVAQARLLTTRVVLDISSALFDVGGSSSARAGNGLDRYWRDARTHTLHDAVRWKSHTLGWWATQRVVADPWSIGHPYKPFDELLAAHREARS